MASRNTGGRPTKFEATVALRIVADVARGETVLSAAAGAGVSRSSLYRWRAKDRTGLEPYAAFARAIDAAGRAASYANLLDYAAVVRIAEGVL